MKNFLYILTHTSGNLTLEYNPTNWDELNIVFKRSKRYHSVLRKQILDMEFPFDGKAYIDTIYETYGIDTDIGCEIQYLNKQTLGYLTLFDGVIDLTEWSSLRDTTTVKIIDSSVMAKFAARDNIKIPTNRTEDLDGNALSSYTFQNQMTIEPVDIEEKAEYIDATNSINITLNETADWTDYHGVSNEGFDFNEIGTDADIPDVTLGGADGPIYTNNTGSTVTVRFRVITRIHGNVNADWTSGSWSWAAKAWTGKDVPPPTTAINIVNSGSATDNMIFDTTYDSGYLTETLAAGEKIQFFHEWSGEIAGVTTIEPGFLIEPTHIEVFKVTEGLAATDVDMPLLHELGAKLLEIMTGVADPLDAPLIGRTDSEPRTYVADGAYSLNGVASGFMIRGYTSKPLTTTFANYFKSIDALFNLGCWYDGTEFSISAKEDFYKVANIITLGEVKDLEVSIAQEEYFNTVKGGYSKEVDYEEINGIQVPNVQMEFSNDGKRIENTLDIASVYRGDDYGIELARQIQARTNRSKDTRYDNNNFFIIGQRDSGDYITLQGYDNFTVISNVYTPDTRLNLDITPKRNLLRHLDQLSIPLFITNGDTNFMRTQFDLDLETQKSGDPLILEKDDLAYGDLDEPLYYPELYNFSSELTNAMIAQLITDPHGYVDFDYLGVTYSGYIMQVSTEPFNRKGNWTLIKRNPNR